MLRRSDLEAIVDFLGDVAWMELDEAYQPEMLARLRELIAFDFATYQEYDYGARRHWLALGIEDGESWRWDAAAGDTEDEYDLIYWRVGPCQIMDYRSGRGRLESVRMSDVVARRRYHESPIYREYLRPLDVEHLLDIGLPERSSRQRSLNLMRAPADRDFSERDRSVLELLRPHLYHLETHTALRLHLATTFGRQDPAERDAEPYCALTPREREIVELVAEGKTNAEIAALLWVAPSTVKKHLEHVYAKLGVGRRAAVATLARPAG